MATHSQKGFTLLEMLVSVIILAVVAILIVQVLFTTTHVNQKTKVLSDIKQNGNFTQDIIGRMVRSAQTIETSCVNGATSASVAQITNPDDNVTTFTCLTDGNVARIASVSAGVVVYLTAGNVTVSSSGGATCDDSSLTFSCPPSSGIQDTLTVSFTLVPKGVSGSEYDMGSTTFQSTVGLRN